MKNYTAIWQRAKAYGLWRGMLPEDADELAQEFCIAMHKGWRATLKQTYTDFMRNNYGSMRTRAGKLRAASRQSTVPLFDCDEVVYPDKTLELLGSLTPKQMEVFDLAYLGNSTEQIARLMKTTMSNIYRHIADIRTKAAKLG